jgi:hypothetical protein
MALIEQVHILQEKGKTEDARRICETIMTQYRDSYAAMEASQLLRTFLKTAKPETPPVVAPAKTGASVTATVPPTMKIMPAAPPAPNGAPSVTAKPSPAPSTTP